MKKILIGMFFLLLIMVFFLIKNTNNKYYIYYFPLETNFYVPPSRKDIVDFGLKFEIDSLILKKMFNVINRTRGSKSIKNDYNGLRIMIIDKNDNEIFITDKKLLLSFNKKKKYNIDIQIIEKILNELNVKAKSIEAGNKGA